MQLELKTYIGFIFKEVIDIKVYLTAGLIGTITCYLTANYSVIPYVVPLIVQILFRAHIKFRNRHLAALVELPAQTESPAFIMDMEGRIILSIGKTLELFNRYGIENVKDFINEQALGDIINVTACKDTSFGTTASVEAFSNRTFKWYEIKAKATGLDYRGKDQKVLAWFQDISLRKVYQLRLNSLLRYSDSLFSSLESAAAPGAETELLSSFILKEYEAVFIAREGADNTLEGNVFKNTVSRMVVSGPITVPNVCVTPEAVSVQTKQLFSDDVSAYGSEKAFFQANPFDPGILEFIDAPIQNFITINEASISITAFNFRSKITEYEKDFFKVVVNVYKTMIRLVDLQNRLENKKQPDGCTV